MVQQWRTWRAATADSLYGAAGFYRRPDGPARHFRTSVSASPAFSEAVRRLAEQVDVSLGRPDPFDLVDVGAGRGELLSHLAAGAPARWRLSGVELADRPAGLAARIGWHHAVPPLTGLLFANEWLDNIPVDVAVCTPDGPRLLVVDTDGRQRIGPPPTPRDGAWLSTWWPLRQDGDRAEVGHPREDAWALAVHAVRRGVAVGVDYAHLSGARPPGGSLAGYRAGQQVAPAPDTYTDITAHVALDACAAAGLATRADHSILVSQRDALHALGLRGTPPSSRLAAVDPAAYLAALQAATEAADLTRPEGLGGFIWLVQSIGCELPRIGPTAAGRS